MMSSQAQSQDSIVSKSARYPGMEMSWWLSTLDTKQSNAREKIMLAAFREIHLKGYQAASIQNIIDQAGVTKGALYHHFKSKHALITALLDEVLSKYVEHIFIKPMQETDDPINTLIKTLMSLKSMMSDEDVALGCPLDSLAQEMAPIDENIRKSIKQLYQRKQDALCAAFKRGQLAGTVKAEVDPQSIALMISATLQGCMGIAKSARSLQILEQCGLGLIHYLQQLKGDDK